MNRDMMYSKFFLLFVKAHKVVVAGALSVPSCFSLVVFLALSEGLQILNMVTIVLFIAVERPHVKDYEKINFLKRLARKGNWTGKL